MRLSASLRTALPMAGVLIAAFGLRAQTPEPQPKEALGMPPRAAPSEYQAQAQAGSVTIAAEFMGHAVPTPQATYSTEEYVVVETGLFGPPEARIKLSAADFSLRINAKKAALASEHYELTFKSLKDPEWEPPAAAKSKTGLSTGGGSAQGDAAPAPVHMPIELRRVMEQHVQKASLPEGDRALPQAGLIFFQFRGKAQSIRSIELVYDGPAGKATLTLQP
jgi:hypothetical protein